jgi:hypothetical protein
MDAEATTEALARRLLQLRNGREIIAFRRQLSKEQARAVINHPLISAVDRAAIVLAVQFQGDQRIKNNYHWSPDWGFGDSAITHPEDLLHAAKTPAQDDREPT